MLPACPYVISAESRRSGRRPPDRPRQAGRNLSMTVGSLPVPGPFSPNSLTWVSSPGSHPRRASQSIADGVEFVGELLAAGRDRDLATGLLDQAPRDILLALQ